MESFIQAIKPPSKDSVTSYLSADVLERVDFLSVLCKLRPAQELGLSIEQMRDLCHASDIWRVLAATLAYIIQLSTTHAPKSKKKDKKRSQRPDGPDIWQIVYLGCVQVFVTGDCWLLEAATEVSCLLKYPRCTMHSLDFIEGLRECSTLAKAGRSSICRVCALPMGQASGRHAVLS